MEVFFQAAKVFIQRQKTMTKQGLWGKYGNPKKLAIRVSGNRLVKLPI